MTTFAYTITMNDNEAITLKVALELMIGHCQQKLDEGQGAPYCAQRESAQSVLEKLFDNITQTSFNNIFDDKK